MLGKFQQESWRKKLKTPLLEQGEFQQFHGKKQKHIDSQESRHGLPVDFSSMTQVMVTIAQLANEEEQKLCEMAWMLWAKSGETRGDDRNPCTYCISSSFN